jgi:hypothetical protein
MTTATATRAPSVKTRAKPLGSGDLHQALEESRDLAKLHAFCRANVCTASDVSSDGKRLDMLRVFDLMRTRGYAVSPPTKASHQPKKGFTAWLVAVALPGPGARFTLGFYASNSL